LTTSISPLIGGLTTSIRTASGSLRNGAHPPPPSDAASTKETRHQEANAVAGALTQERGGSGRSGGDEGAQQVRAGLWSTWQDVGGRRHLVVLEQDGLRLWDGEDLNEITEATWIRWSSLKRPSRRSDQFRPVRARILPQSGATGNAAFSAGEGAAVAVLFASRDRSRLDVVSTTKHEVVKTIEIKGIATDLQLNDRFLAIGCRSPLSIHLLDITTLSSLPCSPISADLAAHPTLEAPIFTLGSARLLAYATSRRPRSPHLGGGGGGLGGASVSTRSTSSSWRDSVSSSAEAVEAARRVGGGLFSGAKALGSWGQQYWTNSLSPENVTSPLRAFSKSAPQPSLGVGSMAPLREDDDVDDLTEPPRSRQGVAIRGGGGQQPKATRRSSFLSAGDRGHVKVVDLASLSPSNDRTAALPNVVAHFSAGQESLALLSFNPSSSFLLTASIEGHAFDVFELRPPSRVGRSATRGYPPRSADRDPTVWHRFKLYRGVTTAETKSVTWSWDSRLVAVATERGTHRESCLVWYAGGAA